MQPRWSRNNREIYYRGGGHIVGREPRRLRRRAGVGKPTALFTDDYDFGAGASVANYDVRPDEQLIMIRRGANGGKLRVIVNWTRRAKADPRGGWNTLMTLGTSVGARVSDAMAAFGRHSRRIDSSPGRPVFSNPPRTRSNHTIQRGDELHQFVPVNRVAREGNGAV